MNNENTAIAARVAEALKAEGYSNKEVATRLDLSPAQISRLLRGESKIKFEHLAAIGRFLGINPATFLGLKEPVDAPLVTVTEAAEWSSRHPDTIRKYIARGELKTFQRCPKGTHRIRRSDLEACMAGAR